MLNRGWVTSATSCKWTCSLWVSHLLTLLLRFPIQSFLLLWRASYLSLFGTNRIRQYFHVTCPICNSRSVLPIASGHRHHKHGHYRVFSAYLFQLFFAVYVSDPNNSSICCVCSPALSLLPLIKTSCTYHKLCLLSVLFWCCCISGC